MFRILQRHCRIGAPAGNGAEDRRGGGTDHSDIRQTRLRRVRAEAVTAREFQILLPFQMRTIIFPFAALKADRPG